MNIKQKISLLAASLLPVLALSAYFLMTPVRASAAGPPCHASCGTGGLGCQSGGGFCYPNGDPNGIYVFCKKSNGQPMGPGSCSNGFVTCEFGGFC